MIRICCILLVIAAMASGAPASSKPYYKLEDAPTLFEKFIKDYDKVYKDDADRALHYEAFVRRLDQINKANAANSSATYDINKFADYTAQDSKHLTGVLRPNSST
ncbi:senescence-specific cysteine protease SAG39-like [Zerene cesonia]|uniref:senescence-specific cysteine protease SAG39-like n=1 Tax=Zerene cesonia TaxID=33412 RepID=UPI0018E4FB4C|nr:senescence-specific cysteine protease SAG39-like [Zerene cesonia]